MLIFIIATTSTFHILKSQDHAAADLPARYQCPILRIPAAHVLLYHSICKSSIMCTCGIPSPAVNALNWMLDSPRNCSLKVTCVSRQRM